ncbi:MAG: hypothetical protein ACE5IM_02105, partial [Nitrospinota bacterium]
DEDLPEAISREACHKIETLIRQITQHLDDDRRGERLRDGLYLTIVGWLIWMVVVGYLGLRAPNQPVSVNLAFAPAVALLTFVDLFGFWLVIGRWQARRRAAIAAKKDAETTEGAGPTEAETAAPAAASTQGPGAPQEKTRGGILRALPCPPDQLWKHMAWLGALSAAVAVAIIVTSAAGQSIFLPGTGAIKGAIAVTLSVWIFVEPSVKDDEGKSRWGALAAKAGLGLGLLCFASDSLFPWFGAAGVVAGGAAAALGKWGVGLYAAVISGAAWALQWWGVTLQ